MLQNREQELEIRKARKDTLYQIRRGQLQAYDLLYNLDDYPHMRNLKVYKFISAFKRAGDKKALIVMLELDLHNATTLEKLTNKQKVQLISKLNEWGVC